jgi:hypothetical protein
VWNGSCWSTENGRFTVTLPAQAGATTIYRADTTVGRNRTFTLPIAVPGP